MKSISLVLFMLISTLSFSETLDLDTEIRQLPTGTFKGHHDWKIGAYTQKEECLLEVTHLDQEEEIEDLYEIKITIKVYSLKLEEQRIVEKTFNAEGVKEFFESGIVNVKFDSGSYGLRDKDYAGLHLNKDGDGYSKYTVTTYTSIQGIGLRTTCHFPNESK